MGGTVAGCLVAALFFVKFWRKSGDALFAFFATAFALLAVNWAILAFFGPAEEVRTVYYLFRLAAFVLILAAIWQKNRAGS